MPYCYNRPELLTSSDSSRLPDTRGSSGAGMGMEENDGGPDPFLPSFQNPGNGFLHSGDPSFTTNVQNGVQPGQAVPMGFPTFNWTSNDPGFLISTNTTENPMPPSLPSIATTIQWPSNLPKKRKRGRPRKYQAPETVSAQGSVAEQPNKAPPTGSAQGSPVEQPTKVPATCSAQGSHAEQPTVRKLSLKQQLSRCGSIVSASAGTRLLPHVLSATPGEDIAELILAFKETTTQAFCVTSASGVFSSVTICNSGSAAGTVTYKGRLEISSLSGSYIPFENNRSKLKLGGLNILVMRSDGQLIGGHVAGPLLAETPIQMQIFSFKFSGESRDSSEADPLFCEAGDS